MQMQMRFPVALSPIEN